MGGRQVSDETRSTETVAAALPLPGNRPARSRSGRPGPLIRLSLDGGLGKRLARFAAAERATEAMVLLSAFTGVLARYAQRTAVTVAADFGDGRGPQPVRVDVPNQMLFGELVRAVRDEALDVVAERGAALDSAPPPDLNHPVFRAVAGAPQSADAATGDLTLIVGGGSDAVDAALGYDVGVWDHDTAAEIAAAVEQLLADGLGRPTTALPGLRLLPPAAEGRVLATGRSTAAYAEQ